MNIDNLWISLEKRAKSLCGICVNGTTEIEKAIYDISLNSTKGSSNFKEAALVLQWHL